MTRILHTSDWHLGSILIDLDRSETFQSFLDYLHELIVQKEIDCLLVSGDVFDTVNPSNDAKGQYYRFLEGLQGTPCHDIVIISGNHDSPGLLAAPKELLRHLGIHIVTRPDPERLEDELVAVKENVVVLAVPYLRDGYLGERVSGDDPESRQASFQEQVKEHLGQLSAKASELYPNRTQVLMMHEYLVGSRMDDGRRLEWYVGNLGALSKDIIPSQVAYTALGHIHRPQEVAGHVRYSGSPLPIDFGETGVPKSVIELTVDHEHISEEAISLPAFCHMERIEGDMDALAKQLEKLKDDRNTEYLVAATYTGDRYQPNLRETLRSLVEGSNVTILTTEDRQQYRPQEPEETTTDLKTLKPMDVFEMKLKSLNADAAQEAKLKELFQQILEEATCGSPA